MANQRNTEGLRLNAQKKRKESFDRVDKGIQELIRSKQRINFNTVAAASGVSKAFLYKESEVKARIEHLRQQHGGNSRIPLEQRASDASKDAVIKTLKERIKALSERVRALEHQNAVAYGKIAEMNLLENKTKS
jgi:hypothetical protein